MSRVARMFGGESVVARAARSAGLTIFGFGTSQVLRLASNLILTRLLFPEAFGTMALISVFLMGLNQFSDVGVSPAIMQSKRGDDRDFLDTAWTIQVLRGLGLFAVACAIAWPVSVFYELPELTLMLPVSALTLVLAGFLPTRMDSAQRHLRVGRLTLLDIGNQAIGIGAAVLLAWWWQSVWALVASGVLGAVSQLVLHQLFLPGAPNRFRWESRAARELIGFGKWIFLSTVAGFALTQADKLMIGKYLALDLFGVYNIGFFLASFPLLMGGMLVRRILIPIYREWPPRESAANFARLRRMRLMVSGALFGLVAVLALGGVWIVDLLYDPRYAMAGAVVVVIACMQVPQIIALTYDQAALAAGDSKRFFVLAASKAVAMVAALLIGLEWAGLFGALIGQGVAMVAVYPVVIWLSRSTGAWDRPHDAGFALAGMGLIVLAFWLNADAIAALAETGRG
ncbi:oligosaccharide flippase family protein [Aquicoccus porphyridii]|uniref:Oligosaccharide flippase family protein n=1 Tax=Aquicoccus porphyridii TaxID=1852029 RepID=A0A5A9ZTC7_9RHOB|nr:oligosaccharide flippase family protein [Aquicoccus porphyridii]KAA0920369.1 oligosaccharide flippase family protein [Aquicoccus porphyridii]RAI54838.1 polysaccharide biosynthesis protein [Rhodobacteraceae bacterium AsT-22]